MRRGPLGLGLVACLWLAGAPAPAGGAGGRVLAPYEVATWPIPETPLDRLVVAGLRQRSLQLANPSSDDVFIRRVSLDLTGTLPTPEEWLAFRDDKDPEKRAKLIDDLMQRDAFLDYQTLKWCDILRVKAEFPINLWPNAVQAYHRWVRDALKADLPYDAFVRALLTSNGSNFRVAPVNFYRATQNRDAAALAEAVALTFMGTRYSSLPEARQADLAKFFSRLKFKRTAEWKEEIVCLDPAPSEPIQTTFPDGKQVTIQPDQDPREVFCDWLLQPDNPWFAKAVVNRLWSWLLGRGIVHEPDDFRADNPPSNPQLLDYLAAEVVKSKWDLRTVYKLICNSRTYQQSALAAQPGEDADRYFGCYLTRRLDAEVLIDVFCWLSGIPESYSSPIPEPFTWIPEDQRSIALADGSITSSFLELFGRPSRDTGLESERNNGVTDSQRLYLLNSSDVQKRLARGGRVQGCVGWAKGDLNLLISALYVNIYTRRPTAAETAAAVAYQKSSGLRFNDFATDLSWALINSKEFLYRH